MLISIQRGLSAHKRAMNDLVQMLRDAGPPDQKKHPHRQEQAHEAVRLDHRPKEVVLPGAGDTPAHQYPHQALILVRVPSSSP